MPPKRETLMIPAASARWNAILAANCGTGSNRSL
jgi:hypothetical protein